MTTLSFVIYLVCWGIEWLRGRKVNADEVRAASYAAGAGLSGVPAGSQASGAPARGAGDGAGDKGAAMYEPGSCSHPEHHDS